MKTQLLILSAILIGLTAFGQKNELKAAEKAIKSNDFTAAMSAINQAESLIANADQKTKAKFYYLKGKALYQNGANQEIEKVGAAFNQLIDYEKETKVKYSVEIGELINQLISNTANSASSNYKRAVETKSEDDYIIAAKGFYKVYALSPRDTSFLDNAALLYYLGKDYTTSVKMYEKLKEVNYTGISTQYVATNKDDGKEVFFSSKKDMDLQVKIGIVENPKEEVKDSRREVIYKNLALNYSMLEDNDKALETIAEGRKEFPTSYSLLIDEANIYFKKGDNNTFKEKLEEAISLNPTEPTLYYNVGVMNMEQKNIEEAVKYFEKAIELKPDYSDAYNNIGAAIIEKADPIIEEMNNSLSDFDKYDKLQLDQMNIYKEAIPYYEKAYEFNDSSLGIIQTLMGLYENLNMTDKYNDLKVVYDQLKE